MQCTSSTCALEVTTKSKGREQGSDFPFTHLFFPLRMIPCGYIQMGYEIKGTEIKKGSNGHKRKVVYLAVALL